MIDDDETKETSLVKEDVEGEKEDKDVDKETSLELEHLRDVELNKDV